MTKSASPISCRIARPVLIALIAAAGTSDTVNAIGGSLLVFGAGTVGGMMLITMSIASAFNFFGKKHANFSHWLGFASGLLSLAFGLFLAYQIGFANGLFSGHPQWTPR